MVELNAPRVAGWIGFAIAVAAILVGDSLQSQGLGLLANVLYVTAGVLIFWSLTNDLRNLFDR